MNIIINIIMDMNNNMYIIIIIMDVDIIIMDVDIVIMDVDIIIMDVDIITMTDIMDMIIII